MSGELSLDDLFREAGPYLIGVWKYRERGKNPQWCATVLVGGEYFDVELSETIRETLGKVMVAVRASLGD